MVQTRQRVIHSRHAVTTSAGPTRYAYDHAQRLEQVTDPAGNRWTYDYELRGRKTSASDPDKGRTVTTYDEIGNVLTTTDARSQVLGYTYDNLNRRTTMRSGGTSGTVRARWAYDTVAKGQIASTTRVQGSAEYKTTITGYSNDYQPLGQTVLLPNDASLGALAGQSYITEYAYTVDGRQYDTHLPAAANLPAEHTRMLYDGANQPRKLAGAGDFGFYVGHATWSTYGQLEYMDLGSAYSYEYALGYEYGTRRLMDVRQSVEKPDGSIPAVLNASYSWDKAGNLTAVKDNPHTGGGRSPDRQCFTYDWANRLSQAWTPAGGDCAAGRSVAALGGADPYWNSYTYEVTGNRETVTARTPGGTTTAQYAHPAQGATSVQPHAPSSVTATGQAAGVSQFTWDATGNMTGRKVSDGAGGRATQSLTWDAEGELAAVGQDGNADGDVVDAGEAVAGGAYVYTADGERLVRTQGSGSARKTTVYLPGGQEVTASASGQVSAVRYYGFAGQTIAMRTGMLTDEMVSISPDHHGSGSVQITNLTSTVTRRYVDPFGAERGTAGPSSPGAGVVSGWAGDHGFLDKPADATGLTAVGARMYDPGLGSFVSVDPIMDLTDPQQWHGYAYAHSNPTTFSDPTGLREFASGDPRDDTQKQIASAVQHSTGRRSAGGGGSSGGGSGGGGSSGGGSADEIIPPVVVYAPRIELSPDECPACWGLVPMPPPMVYPDHRPQWLANFEGAHPNIATYSGLSDFSGCFLRGGVDDSCAAVGVGVVLAPVGGAAAGVGIKAGVKALGRIGGKTSTSTVVMGGATWGIE